MDTKESIEYRGVELNSVTLAGGGYIGSGITGIEVTEADFSDVDVEQYVEQRSLHDGMDAGDPFLRARKLAMAGTLYGLTRAEAFDTLQTLRRTFSATSASRETVPGETFSGADAPTGHKGFLPIYFSVPTARTAEYPEGRIEQKMFAAPRSFRWSHRKDSQGGKGGDPLAIPWRATLLARDPRVYARDVIAFESTTGGDAIWQNRGDYDSPVNAFFIPGTAGTITLVINGTTLEIEVPTEAIGFPLFYSGATKLLTLDGIPRLDLITPAGVHPVIEPGGAEVSFSLSGGVTLSSGRLAFLEAFA